MTTVTLVTLVALVLVLVRGARARAWQDGPHYVEQLRRWNAIESEITPLNLPAVRPLKGVKQRKARKPRQAPIDAQKRFAAR